VDVNQEINVGNGVDTDINAADTVAMVVFHGQPLQNNPKAEGGGFHL
jgi:hypothetical protein